MDQLADQLADLRKMDQRYKVPLDQICQFAMADNDQLFPGDLRFDSAKERPGVRPPPAAAAADPPFFYQVPYQPERNKQANFDKAMCKLKRQVAFRRKDRGDGGSESIYFILRLSTAWFKQIIG